MNRLLVANRGEIARRILRTCRRLGIETVAVFSDPDADADFVTEADLAVALGGETPADSYLRADAVVAAALRADADAVHPGYGFLAENADFARAVTAAGLTFVGPTPEAIDAMGSKLEAKARMEAAGVPLLASAEVTEAADLTAAAEAIGYPVLVKASAGGGGRGMRIVAAPDELDDAVAGARREAGSAFGDDTVYLERYVTPSRHVEVQILGDAAGTVIHLHERECSIQRRHQKVIEEAPSASISAATRTALHAAAVEAGRAIGYQNAGTVEFLVGPDEDFFFLEVNTRLQVEHPVTEAVLGLDLVELQLAVAEGAPVPDQSEIGPVRGHAIEARLYAEDPTEDYRPSTGTVTHFAVPGAAPTTDEAGLRVDGAFATRGTVSQFYDPMVAKVISHAPTREAASRRLATALAHTRVDGIATNRALLVRTLRHEEWRDGRGDSGFLDRHDPAALGAPLVAGEGLRAYAAAGALARQARHRAEAIATPAASSGFRNVPTEPQQVTLLSRSGSTVVHYRFVADQLEHLAVDGADPMDARLWSVTSTTVDLAVDGLRARYDVHQAGDHLTVSGPDGSADFEVEPRFVPPTERVEPGSLVATMPGTVVAVHCAAGDAVTAGDPMLTMEAMKMELTLEATMTGTVETLAVAVGDNVPAGHLLALIVASD